MKLIWKIFISLGAILIAVGVTVLIIGYAMNDWKSVSVNYEIKSEEFEGVTKINVDADALNVEFEFYDGEKLLVEYPVREGYLGAETSQVGGEVTLKSSYIRQFNSFSIFGKGPSPIVFRIPNSIEPVGVAVETGAGNVKFAEGVYGDVDIDLDAGNFKAKEITAKNMQIDLNAGNVVAISIKCDKLTASLDCGNFTVDKIECPDISVENDCGNVNCTVAGSRTEYNITSNCDLGNCNLQSREDPSAEKRLSVDVSLGNLEVSFTQD